MNLIRLETLDDPRLDAYTRLTERELRCVLEPEKGIFIAESAKVIERAVRAGLEPVSFLMGERWLSICSKDRMIGPRRQPQSMRRLFRPCAAQPRHGLPPRHRQHARTDGHFGGILAS